MCCGRADEIINVDVTVEELRIRFTRRHNLPTREPGAGPLTLLSDFAQLAKASDASRRTLADVWRVLAL